MSQEDSTQLRIVTLRQIIWSVINIVSLSTYFTYNLNTVTQLPGTYDSAISAIMEKSNEHYRHNRQLKIM